MLSKTVCLDLGYLLYLKRAMPTCTRASDNDSGSGKVARRALNLARIRVANRTTLRAFDQAYETAVGADETHTHAASDSCLLLANAGVERPLLDYGSDDCRSEPKIRWSSQMMIEP